MTSNIAQIWKAIKPHVPLIKFRKGGTDKSLVAATANVLSTPKAQPNSVSNAPPIGCIPRGSGIDEEFLPPKYHRKLPTLLEMEIVERGGPDKL